MSSYYSIKKVILTIGTVSMAGWLLAGCSLGQKPAIQAAPDSLPVLEETAPSSPDAAPTLPTQSSSDEVDDLDSDLKKTQFDQETFEY